MRKYMSEGTILIIEDELVMRKFLKDLLRGEGYSVIAVKDGEGGLRYLSRRRFDLVITDLLMPKMDGYEVCKTIKKNVFLRHIPVILLTKKGEIMDKIKGIYVGADDYVVKPFEPTELLARVKMTLRRSRYDLDANPLTKLPGNVSIIKEIERRVKSRELFAVSYFDLDKFKEFNDKYGFERGDKVIYETARIIIEAMNKFGNPDDFIGHIGGDDFVVVTNPRAVDSICQQTIGRFEKIAPSFYNKKDRERGYIISRDRQGRNYEVPLLTISIGAVTNQRRKIVHVGMVGQIGTELKAYAKSFEGNNYVKDRRRDKKRGGRAKARS